MKPCVLVLLLIAGVTRLCSHVVSFEVFGLVDSSSTATFAVGDPYTFTFSFDSSLAPSLALDGFASYDRAATDVVFNYASGAYVGTATDLSIWMEHSPLGDGFAVGLPAAGALTFAPVDGKPFATAAGNPLLSLVDESGASLSSTSLADFLTDYPGFLTSGASRVLLNWGDAGEIMLSGTIDSVVITNQSSAPEPAAFAAVAGAFALLFVLRRRRA